MSSPVATLAAPSDLSRRILGLLNLYRLLIPPTLLAIREFTVPEATVGQVAPTLFLVVCALYFVAGILLVLALRLRSLPLRSVAITHGLVDALGIAALMYVSGGVASGLGVLLALPVAATALLAEPRTAAFIAASTSSTSMITPSVTNRRRLSVAWRNQGGSPFRSGWNAVWRWCRLTRRFADAFSCDSPGHISAATSERETSRCSAM
jgi:hypothetical protein